MRTCSIHCSLRMWECGSTGAISTRLLAWTPGPIPTRQWWKEFPAGFRTGTGFWHETYFRDGAVESVYIDMPPSGLTKFAPNQQARGSLFSARRRLGLKEEGTEPAPVVTEEALYKP